MGGPGSGPAERAPETGPPEVGESLRSLLLEVHRARAAQVEEQAGRGATAQTLLPVRRATLEALENYNVALRLRGWPTPPQMRLDIQLLRSLCGVTRP